MDNFYKIYTNNIFSYDEQNIINQYVLSHNDDEKLQISSNEINNINNKLLQMLPYKHDNTWQFLFDTCATNLIQKLFNEYVLDDDVLIITSYQEHPKVNEILANYKNVLYLIDDGKIINTMSLNDILNELNKYKFIFVYCIGTICGTGRYVDQIVFKTIKKLLMLSNKPHVFVIDAVQELFMLPRDYSIFDYVIGTAHAIIPRYNIGFSITRKNVNATFFPSTIYKFINMFQIINKRHDYISQFSKLLTKRYLNAALKHNLIINAHSHHIWSIGDKFNTLKQIIPINQKSSSNAINDRSMHNLYFRATWSLFNDDSVEGYNFIHLLNKLDDFLDII